MSRSGSHTDNTEAWRVPGGSSQDETAPRHVRENGVLTSGTSNWKAQLALSRLRRQESISWATVIPNGQGPVIGMVPSANPAANVAYAAAVTKAQGILLPIPPIANPKKLLTLYQSCDGLLLAGGPDIAPHLYGEAPREAARLDPPSVTRDAMELLLTKWAVQDKMPVLGVCRGLQVLNVAQGGTLWQDIVTDAASPRQHRIALNERHTIRTRPGSRLARLVGETGEVNSLHHQAIRRLGKDVSATALSLDLVVEAIELKNHPFAVGVQFHPELMLDGPVRWPLELFSSLTRAALQFGRNQHRRGHVLPPGVLWTVDGSSGPGAGARCEPPDAVSGM